MGGYPSREASPTPSPSRSRLGARPTVETPRPLLDEARLREASRWPTHPHDIANPVQHRSPLQRSGIVQNVVNIDKHSLAVHPSPEDPRVLLLQFDFSALVAGYISVFFCAKQVLHRGANAAADAPVRRVSYVTRPPKEATGAMKREKTKFEPGVALRYKQKAAKGIRLDDFDEMRLMEVVDEYFPIVIRIEAKHDRDSTIAKDARVVSQSTFAALVKHEDDSWGIKLIRQEVLVAGTIYVVQELYGIGAADVTASKSAHANSSSENVYSIDASNECVICLVEPCNTAVLPCNHLCLCQDCGAKLSTDPSLDRRRCPICRTDLESLLRIIPTTLPGDGTKHNDTDMPIVGMSGEGSNRPLEGAEKEAEGLASAESANDNSTEGLTTSQVSKPSSAEQLDPEEEASLSSDLSEATARDEDGAVTPLSSPVGLPMHASGSEAMSSTAGVPVAASACAS